MQSYQVQSYKVSVSKLAEFDLLEIYHYYNELNPRVANSILDTLEIKAESLASFPYRGKVVPELLEYDIDKYRQLIAGNHRIIYRVTDNPNSVIILAVVDSRKDLEEWLLARLNAF